MPGPGPGASLSPSKPGRPKPHASWRRDGVNARPIQRFGMRIQHLHHLRIHFDQVGQVVSVAHTRKLGLLLRRRKTGHQIFLSEKRRFISALAFCVIGACAANSCHIFAPCLGEGLTARQSAPKVSRSKKIFCFSPKGGVQLFVVVLVVGGNIDAQIANHPFGYRTIGRRALNRIGAPDSQA